MFDLTLAQISHPDRERDLTAQTSSAVACSGSSSTRRPANRPA